MDKVYFLKDFSKLAWATGKIFKDFYPESPEIMVKIHFGEPGNEAAFTPKDISPIINTLNNRGFLITLFDTPVAYASPRNTVRGYENVAQKKGFGKLGKILISNKGVKVKTKHFVAKVAKPLVEAKNVLVISHVKGHPCSGFGGAIKNLGMGGVTKETKRAEHDLCKPVKIKECRACGTCVKFCPAKGIKVVNKITKPVKKEVVFNHDICWGCSICEIECPYRCLIPIKATFDDLLAQGASAIINHLPKKTFYINFLKNIVKNCDCSSRSGPIISRDIGVLFSENPVAIDKASVDLVNKINGENLFLKIHHKDPLLQINFAEKYTKWKNEYLLVPITHPV